MIGPDRVVPGRPAPTLLERYGAGLRRRLNAASRLLNTLALRGLNQQVIDGRLPEAVGGEFVDANGLGGTAQRKPGPRIVVGYQAFAENETLAHLYAEALRAGGYRVTVRGRRRPAPRRPCARCAAAASTSGPATAGSLREYLGGRTLRRALARIGAAPLALAQAQNRNVFATKTDTARRLGLETLSDLTARWSPRAPRDRAAAGRAVGVRRGQRARPARARGSSRRARARSSRSSTPGPSSTTPTSRRTSGPTSARCPATASTTTATATSTTSTAST